MAVEARARAAQRHYPLLRDLKAVEIARLVEVDAKYGRGAGGSVTVLRTVLMDDWVRVGDRRGMAALVAQSPGPYFFVADGVLAYLTEEQVSTLLTRIKHHSPNARVALDTFPQRTFDQQRKLAARRGIPARWAWACEDPRSLERLGLRVVETTGLARLPGRVRRQLPARYRFLLPLAEPILGQAMRVTLLQA